MSKVAVITGAGSGIGKAVALAFLKDGYSVAIAGRRADALETTVKAAGPDAARMLAVPTDVSKPASVQALFAKVKERFGRVDVLFNNAGTNPAEIPFEEMPFDKWQATVDTNLTGSFLCAQEAYRMMKSQDPRGGRIINNGSISAYSPRPDSVPYSSTKHAITGLTKCISLDGRKYDIACGQIDIGNAVSEMAERMARGVKQADGSIKPEPLMNVANVASTVLYMANLPVEANVQFVTVMATKMPFVGRG
jgi:NAD(P)-dependent dehydrogenase (short-subunit alcohol dehydrogenase family)